MPVTSQEIVEDSLQADGRRRLIYQYTFHEGSIVTLGSRLVVELFDADTDLLFRISEAELNKDEQEQENAISRIEKGEDSLVVAQSFIHSTEKKIARKLILWAVSQDNPKTLDLIAGLIDYLITNFTNTQIKNFLQVTNLEWLAIKARYKKWREEPTIPTSPGTLMAGDTPIEVE